MTDRHSFQTLRDSMTPTQRARTAAKADALRKEMKLAEQRQADLDEPSQD